MATIKLGDAEIHTVGDLPEVGSKAPDFTLTGTEFEDLRLSDFEGKRVVLNIFPSIATGVCALSARRFNERAGELDDAVIVTVSKDLPFPLQKFRVAEGIDSAILTSAFRSDFGESYGATIIDGPWAGLLSRAVVVLDSEHTVVYTEQVPQIGDEPDYDAALEAVTAAS